MENTISLERNECSLIEKIGEKMSKVEMNKQNKRLALLDNAYSLFIEKGFNNTTISDIVTKAGIAKGTFYLYFKDKFDLKDEIIARKSIEILLKAEENLKSTGTIPKTLKDGIIAFSDYILDYFKDNKLQMNFISKNLSWGVFKHIAESDHSNEKDREEIGNIYKNFLQILEANEYKCKKPEILLFTIIEFINSTGYSAIMGDAPCSLEEYKPFLHDGIEALFDAYRV